MGTRLAMSSAYHPQTDGQTERLNQIVEQLLRAACKDDINKWDLHLPVLDFAYNNAKHAATGETPFFLCYGRHPLTPQQPTVPATVQPAHDFVTTMQQLWDRTHKRLQDIQSSQKRLADRHRRDHTIAVGDHVTPVTFRLRLPASWKIHNAFHVQLLKPYQDPNKLYTGRQPPPPPPILVNDELEYEVESVLAHRRRRHGALEFLVRWKGYDPSEDSWCNILEWKFDPVTPAIKAPAVAAPLLLQPLQSRPLLSRPCPAPAPAAPPSRAAQPTEPRRSAEPRCPAKPHCPTEPRCPTEPHCPACTAPAATAASTTTAATAAIATTAAMASPTVLTFDAEGRAVDFDVWVDDLQLFLQCDSRDGVSLFDHTSGVSTAPAATAESTVRSQWTTRDAVARLAVRSHLPPAEHAHFGQYKTAQSLYDAVVACYSSPATAALSRLMLPYLFPDLAAFATVADLITHLRTSDARYRAALPT
ncbi:unnamed protein product, partial [Closterium sp. NIES-53]